jgi:hypothetical protein
LIDNRKVRRAAARSQSGSDWTRLIHHSEILSLKGDSYQLRRKDLDARIGAKPAEIA